MILRRAFLLGLVAAFVSGILSPNAQEVSIPDPGLNAAIREALQKPSGPLTQQDLLNLQFLTAIKRNIHDLTGLEAASNLLTLSLISNQLSNITIPPSLTKLDSINLSSNPLGNCAMPDSLIGLHSITIDNCQLTNLTLAAPLTNLMYFHLTGNRFTNFTIPPNVTHIVDLDLTQNELTSFDFGNLARLDSLELENNDLTSFNLPARFTNLTSLYLGFNQLTNCTLPSGLTQLETISLPANQLANFNVPSDASQLSILELSENRLTDFTVSPGLGRLFTIDLFFNQLTNVTLPNDLTNLTTLDLDLNQFANLALPANLTALTMLHVRSNHLSSFFLPADATAVNYLDVSENPLTNFVLPAGLGHLGFLRLSETKLTSLRLPVGMTNLEGIYLRSNQLTNVFLPTDLAKLQTIDALANPMAKLDLPSGLTNLQALYLSGNQLTTLTLPPDITRLNSLVLDGNPLSAIVISEIQAATNSQTVATLRAQGIAVYTYPLAVQLAAPRRTAAEFDFTINGPPGIYTVFASTDLISWNAVKDVTNQIGNVAVADASTSQMYYRASRRLPPTNMVFVPPTTFMMGSPVTERDHQPDEMQTIVTLTRGFWIGKYEVTQKEYFSVMGTNGSFFPGDSNPISSMSWLDATNYCWKLTQQERAAGRISGTTRYRLPTEAEWECAARAGTTTRFFYGDDDENYSRASQYAWFLTNELTVHPVGQKLPNPWGLYDLGGNVWEWCQDWYGPLAGGSVVDPQGPPSNQIGFKVMRGGAYDYGPSDCRSARRLYFAVSPFLTDTDLGFRVVLADD